MASLTNTTLSSFQETICPVYRNILTTPPELTGRFQAFAENGVLKIGNASLTKEALAILSKANDFVLRKIGLDLGSFGASLYMNRNQVALGAGIALVSLQLLYQNLRERPVETIREAPQYIGNQLTNAAMCARVVGQNALKFLGNLPRNTFNVVVGAPRAILNLALATPKFALSVLTHKVAGPIIGSVGAYYGAKEGYDYLCPDYEIVHQKDFPKESLGFFEKMSQSYVRHAKNYPLLKKKIEKQLKAENEFAKVKHCLSLPFNHVEKFGTSYPLLLAENSTPNIKNSEVFLVESEKEKNENIGNIVLEEETFKAFKAYKECLKKSLEELGLDPIEF